MNNVTNLKLKPSLNWTNGKAIKFRQLIYIFSVGMKTWCDCSISRASIYWSLIKLQIDFFNWLMIFAKRIKITPKQSNQHDFESRSLFKWFWRFKASKFIPHRLSICVFDGGQMNRQWKIIPLNRIENAFERTQIRFNKYMNL